MGADVWLVPAKSQIQMHKVKYRGTPIFGDNGEEYVKYLPGEVKYVGEPSDEIDEAWNELTKSNSSIQMHQMYENDPNNIVQGASSFSQSKRPRRNSVRAIQGTGTKVGAAMLRGMFPSQLDG